MSSEQAARIVFVAGMIEAGYVLLRASRGGVQAGATYKALWAIGLLTLGLAVFADFVPQVAGPFALLVLVAMIVRNRGEVGAVLSGTGHSQRLARYSATTPAPSSGRGYSSPGPR